MQENKTMEVVELDINEVSPNKNQPRKNFDDKSIESLSKSIKKHGIIQPIIVRKIDFFYEIIAGERRWRAAKSLGLKKIPSVIREIEDLEVAQIALVENIQRENLNSIEEAYAFKALIDEHSLTQEKIGELLGKSRSYIANTMRLLKLDDEVKDLIIQNKLTSGHGRTILGLNNHKNQMVLAGIVLDKNLSVRETEALVKKFNKKTQEKTKQKNYDPMIKEIEENLRNSLGTKVQITSGKKKGKIEIEYYSNEEFERIVDLINK